MPLPTAEPAKKKRMRNRNNFANQRKQDPPAPNPTPPTADCANCVQIYQFMDMNENRFLSSTYRVPEPAEFTFLWRLLWCGCSRVGRRCLGGGLLHEGRRRPIRIELPALRRTRRRRIRGLVAVVGRRLIPCARVRTWRRPLRRVWPT